MADPVVITLRARIITAPPQAGQLLRAANGRSVYRVEGVRVRRIAGEPPGKTRYALTLTRLSRAQAAAADNVLDWPVAPAPDRPVRAAGLALKPPAPFAAPTPATAPSGAQRRPRRRHKHLPLGHAQQAPMAAVAREAVRDAGGRLVRPPLVVEGAWRDPEDTNRAARTPKLVHGWVATDSIAWLGKQNSKVTAEHQLAADCYRATYERAHRSPAAVHYERSDGGDITHGPTDAAMRAMRAWLRVQRTLSLDARSLLDALVLRRGHVTEWADRWGAGRAYAMGFLIGVLDQLAVYYRAAIAQRRRAGVQEGH